jgi:hypothetical protein
MKARGRTARGVAVIDEWTSESDLKDMRRSSRSGTLRNFPARARRYVKAVNDRGFIVTLCDVFRAGDLCR